MVLASPGIGTGAVMPGPGIAATGAVTVASFEPSDGPELLSVFESSDIEPRPNA